MADAIEEVRNVEDPARNLGLCPACSEPLLEPATGNQIRFMKATWQREPIRSRRGTEAPAVSTGDAAQLVAHSGTQSGGSFQRQPGVRHGGACIHCTRSGRERGQLQMLARFLAGCTAIPLTLKEEPGG